MLLLMSFKLGLFEVKKESLDERDVEKQSGKESAWTAVLISQDWDNLIISKNVLSSDLYKEINKKKIELSRSQTPGVTKS